MSRHTPFNPVDDYNIKVQQAKTFLGFSLTTDVVEVRHGKCHNARFTDGVFYQEQCSVCGEWTYEYSKNYCPNCGAKMDDERRSENGTP